MNYDSWKTSPPTDMEECDDCHSSVSSEKMRSVIDEKRVCPECFKLYNPEME